jgi:membrane associated rhomboid family serine protease
MFLHGGWMHVFINSTMALVMGMGFEKQFGSKAAAFFFFACGLAGVLLYFMLQPFSNVPLIGGSAAISGWFGAMVILFSRQNANVKIGKYGAWPIIAFWVLFFIVMGTIGDRTMAWEAHVGGFLAGIGLLHLVKKNKLKFLF